MAGKESNRKMALERIWRLFSLAESFDGDEPEFARRCIRQACKIRNRYKVTFPDGLRLNYCKKCAGYINQKRATNDQPKTPWIEIRCPHCGANFKRRPVKPWTPNPA
jgi:ribonuclease P protein subunit RPR2